jgi:hypothetical protein
VEWTSLAVCLKRKSVVRAPDGDDTLTDQEIAQRIGEAQEDNRKSRPLD